MVPQKTRYGFIGLGDQGGPMARMMIAGGLDVAVWARRAEVVETFTALGAGAFESPAALAASVDVLCLCVTGDADVLDLVEEQGAGDALPRDALVVVHSTVRPSTCIDLEARLARRGVRFLEAPVSGSGRAALARTLVVMVGGDGALLARAAPAFETYAGLVTHFGPAGSAMKAKLFNNLLSAANMGITSSVLSSAKRQTLNTDDLRRTILASTGRSFALEVLARFQDPDRAAHMARIIGKDVGLARECLDDPALEPLHEAARGLVERLEDWSRGRNLLLSPEPAA